MVREDLIEGAVTFLQDPSVSSAPIEQKLAFLRSKNLTQEEIDASLSRAGQPPTNTTSPQTPNYAAQYRQPPPQYGAYPQQPPYNWGQPPPEPPRRDWRDWFIMATVTGGISYAMYWTAKRYIVPLIAPPTPPQLEQDKASIDSSFDKAFALLDQLATDTQELKDAEKTRTERLDHALAEVESVIGKMKEASENRESEAKRMAREMEEIKEQIPLAIAKEKETMDGRLRDLAGEMKSLKTLVGNRVGQAQAQAQQRPSAAVAALSSQGAANAINGTGSASAGAGGSVAAPATASAPETNGTNGTAEEGEKPAAASVLPERSATGSPYGRVLGGKAAIPSWQLAAKKRSEEANKEAKKEEASQSVNVSESGTVAAETEAGA